MGRPCCCGNKKECVENSVFVINIFKKSVYFDNEELYKTDLFEYYKDIEAMKSCTENTYRIANMILDNPIEFAKHNDHEFPYDTDVNPLITKSYDGFTSDDFVKLFEEMIETSKNDYPNGPEMLIVQCYSCFADGNISVEFEKAKDIIRGKYLQTKILFYSMLSGEYTVRWLGVNWDWFCDKETACCCGENLTGFTFVPSGDCCPSATSLINPRWSPCSTISCFNVEACPSSIAPKKSFAYTFLMAKNVCVDFHPPDGYLCSKEVSEMFRNRPDFINIPPIPPLNGLLRCKDDVYSCLDDKYYEYNNKWVVKADIYCDIYVKFADKYYEPIPLDILNKMFTDYENGRTCFSASTAYGFIDALINIHSSYCEKSGMEIAYMPWATDPDGNDVYLDGAEGNYSTQCDSNIVHFSKTGKPYFLNSSQIFSTSRGRVPPPGEGGDVDGWAQSVCEPEIEIDIEKYGNISPLYKSAEECMKEIACYVSDGSTISSGSISIGGSMPTHFVSNSSANINFLSTCAYYFRSEPCWTYLPYAPGEPLTEGRYCPLISTNMFHDTAFDICSDGNPKDCHIIPVPDSCPVFGKRCGIKVFAYSKYALNISYYQISKYKHNNDTCIGINVKLNCLNPDDNVKVYNFFNVVDGSVFPNILEKKFERNDTIVLNKCKSDYTVSVI